MHGKGGADESVGVVPISSSLANMKTWTNSGSFITNLFDF